MENATQNDTGKTGKPIEEKIGIAVALIIGLALLLLLFFAYTGKHKQTSGHFMTHTEQSSKIASQMKINLLKSVEFEKSAVMAVTDEDSSKFVDQSRKASDAVKSGYIELKDLITTEGIQEELRLIKELGDCLDDFREIDKELLNLSVKNTNIKAANLSYTKSAESMDRFEQALRKLTEIQSNNMTDLRITKAAFRAMTAAFRIYSLQPPHINEDQDKEMDQIESTMRTHEEQVKRSLNEISLLVAKHKEGRNLIKNASMAFADFTNVNKEIIGLSRMNSNVKSLQLSLGKKLQATSQCEKLLDSIQDTIQRRKIEATK